MYFKKSLPDIQIAVISLNVLITVVTKYVNEGPYFFHTVNIIQCINYKQGVEGDFGMSRNLINIKYK